MKNTKINGRSIIEFLIYFMINGFIAYLISNLVLDSNKLLIIDFKISVIFVFIFIYILNSFILNDNEFRIISSTVMKIFRL